MRRTGRRRKLPSDVVAPVNELSKPVYRQGCNVTYAWDQTRYGRVGLQLKESQQTVQFQSLVGEPIQVTVTLSKTAARIEREQREANRCKEQRQVVALPGRYSEKVRLLDRCAWEVFWHPRHGDRHPMINARADGRNCPDNPASTTSSICRNLTVQTWGHNAAGTMLTGQLNARRTIPFRAVGNEPVDLTIVFYKPGEQAPAPQHRVMPQRHGRSQSSYEWQEEVADAAPPARPRV